MKIGKAYLDGMSVDAVGNEEATITATVKALAAAWNLSLDQVADSAQMKRRTFHRRLAIGGWSVAEVSRLAARFGVTPMQLQSGEVTITPPRPPTTNGKRAWRDSNAQPSDPKSDGFTPLAPVFTLHRHPGSLVPLAAAA